MKVRNNRLYPYPVYSKTLNHYVNNSFNVETDLTFDSEKAYINLNIDISDSVLLEMLKNNDIGLYTHVECSVTKYRKLFEIPLKSNGNYTIELPLPSLNENIEVLTVLIATKGISNYTNPNLSEEFQNEVISFPQYSMIGFTDTEEFTINKKIDTNGDIPSIFIITKSEEQDKMTFDAFNEQIQIFLPKDEYDIYESSRGTSRRIKQMMINLPVLVEVIDLIKNENFHDFESCAWYPILEEAFKKQGYLGFEDNSFKGKNSVELGQSILGQLFKDAMNEFNALNSDRRF